PASGESEGFSDLTIVGIKYAKVNGRSSSVARAAASHRARKAPSGGQAANKLANVRSVNGTVVTKAQNLRPVSSRRAASARQWTPDSREEVNQRPTTMRCS